MKIIIKVIALSALMLFAFQVNAEGTENKSPKSFEWAIFPLKNGKLRVNINNPQKQRLVVLIKCMEGETVHRNFIEKKRVKAAISYDVTDLKDGDYQVYVYNNSTVENKTFHIGETVKRLRPVTVD